MFSRKFCPLSSSERSFENRLRLGKVIAKIQHQTFLRSGRSLATQTEKLSRKLSMHIAACLCMFVGDEYASRFLIENGADVNIALPASKWTPLHLAVMQSRHLPSTNQMSGIIELLLQKAANANACDTNSQSVFYAPVMHKTVASFEPIIGGSNISSYSTTTSLRL